jgi:predicted ATPase
LSRLQSALAERARLVLVVGDAGIAKTRFVAEALARASVGGMVAVGGGCLPLAEKLPLLPVTEPPWPTEQAGRWCSLRGRAGGGACLCAAGGGATAPELDSGA